MSLLCWNCRGFGNQRTKNQLADMVWEKDPSIVLIAETWMDKARLVLVQEKIKFKNKFIAPRRN